MFNSPFQFTKLNHGTKAICDTVSIVQHNYCFRGKNNKRYIVHVEEYQYSVFVINFFLADHRNHPDRFNKRTGLRECSRVIATIGHIIIALFKDNPFCSFAFMGANLPGESIQNTKRFRLYSKVVGALISVVEFEHHNSIANSAYLLLNRHHKEPDLLNKVLRVFNTAYDEETFVLSARAV